ncbi:Pecanex-like protein 1 [Micromonospora sp. NPDC050397]|uniref:Pecanex-like protein 1 n=1 Tax=Micromonospora sp. NPDC050397 TaxID=3364279 RepID=UPI003850FF1A
MNDTPARSTRQRGKIRPPRRTRLIAVLSTLVVFGGIVAVTQISSAGTNGWRNRGSNWCPPATSPAKPPTPAPASPGASAPAATLAPGSAAPTGGAPNPSNTAAAYHDHGSIQHPGDGQEPLIAGSQNRQQDRNRGRNCTPSPGAPTSAPPVGNPANPGAPLEILGNSCEQSQKQPHDGFQNGDRCVSTEFGEVATAEDNPSLLITNAPRRVRVNQSFTIRVSTRNLVRDRFLAAGQGGYYKESSFLTEEGLVRGHFHTACRMLTSDRSAPDPAPVPAFFVATEDGKGGARADEVTVTVPGLPAAGEAQCASWAGDGSHRVPMMQRANQIPAFDVVRVTVTR